MPTAYDRGTLNEQKTAITGTKVREEDWDLNQTGNWAGYDVAENGSPVLEQERDNNKANEIREKGTCYFFRVISGDTFPRQA